MIILILFLILITLILARLILSLLVKKYGLFSYDGFSAGGFAYNSREDIFYSTKNAWQKNFGYSRYYDILAPIFRMIIDTEPIRFRYNNQNWLITFWKGQYGIVTGAEIGIYCTTQQKVNKKTIYLPAEANEMLNMDFILYKNGQVITSVKAKHWWLAIFKLGMFSNPKELSMSINLIFPNQEMLEAFLQSFKKLGYKPEDFKVIDNTFCFKYTKPRTHKVWTRTWAIDHISQFFNQKNVELYNKYLDDLLENNKIDDSRTQKNKNLIMINDFIPNLFKNALENSNQSNKIVDEILSKKEPNILFLNRDISSESRESHHE